MNNKYEELIWDWILILKSNHYLHKNLPINEVCLSPYFVFWHERHSLSSRENCRHEPKPIIAFLRNSTYQYLGIESHNKQMMAIYHALRHVFYIMQIPLDLASAEYITNNSVNKDFAITGFVDIKVVLSISKHWCLLKN